MSKITQNGSSLQLILPRSVCESVRLKNGDTLNVQTDGDIITLSRPITQIPLEITEEVKTIFTIGYESRTPEKFIQRLKNHGIQQVIDVREKPISRKAGFSKSALIKCLTEEGIGYYHLPKLGSPSEIRNALKEGGSEAIFFDQYYKYLKETAFEQIDILDQLVSATPSALMCFELSAVHCHRKIIANELSNIGYNVTHL